jgi:hypothetical protein
VPEQERPDPEFPTVAFPNPEEPGAVDLLTALAERVGADVAIAEDPDADRCSVVCGGRQLTGDEVGVLLADWLLRRGVRGTYAASLVSGSLLGRLARAHGVPFAETPTGFKWIIRGGTPEAPLVFGYEEALGYAVTPSVAHDKDGVSAALAVALLAAELAVDGRTLTDRLDELAREHGHDVADMVLEGLAGRLHGVLRRGDVLARTAPDEFVALLPRADTALAAQTAGALRTAAAAGDGPAGTAIGVGITTGIAAAHPRHTPGRVADLVARARAQQPQTSPQNGYDLVQG